MTPLFEKRYRQHWQLVYPKLHIPYICGSRSVRPLHEKYMLIFYCAFPHSPHSKKKKNGFVSLFYCRSPKQPITANDASIPANGEVHIIRLIAKMQFAYTRTNQQVQRRAHRLCAHHNLFFCLIVFWASSYNESFYCSPWFAVSVFCTKANSQTFIRE